MTAVTFSVPANDGSAGHPTTQTSLFLIIPSAPGSDTTILDYDLNSSDYYRLVLSTAHRLRLEFKLTGYGLVSADLGVVPIATWVWVSCGFSTSGGLHIRGDVTPVGGAATTASALASSGAHTGQTLTDLGFGVGVTLTSVYAGFPNAAGWECSRLIQDQIAADDAAGNPRPIPTTDFTSGIAYREYLAHDPLGAAATLLDSGTGGLDMAAGPLGLQIDSDGPALVGAASAPTGSEGAIQIYTGGEWVSLPAGADGTTLQMVAGRPAWV